MKQVISLIILLSVTTASSQLLSTQGKKIVNDQGEEVLLRGYGPGGWQIMEGYMMQTSGIAGSQHEIREKLIELMGEENTETFFEKWRENHFTQRDVDSLAAWGFNSIRIPMHYNLFTLPIEDEPIEGEHTWIETGFQLIDSVLKWSKPHGIYVILDLHAAPGGQGTGSEINDYDPDKPSLWESQANKDKTVALWARIANRYKDEKWIGGYDLINEPHWNLPGGNELRQLYVDITNAIRSVDTDHIIFIEGNWYANDFTGLTPPWDDNMVYSFHKYWSFNGENDLDWVLPLREQHNIPLWMGESGENSNTWFTDAVKLFENNDIGWAWWAVRKIGDIDSPYAIDINPGYQKVIDFWKGEGPQPSVQETFDGMMQLAENLLVENSRYRKDVPDALIRQPHTDETIPYTKHEIPGIIFLSDFDLGKNGFAYSDKDVADYNLSTGSFQAWNSGWAYRNDGVDIQTNEDETNSNGFHVGFTDKGEWIKYTVEILESGTYQVNVRLATDLPNSKFHLSVDDQSITTSQQVAQTGGWDQFATHTIENVILDAGRKELRMHFDQSSVNVGSLEFIKMSDSEISFAYMTSEVGPDEQSIQLSVNKSVNAPTLESSAGLFEVLVNGVVQEVTDVTLDLERRLVLILASPVFYTDQVRISYNGSSILSTESETLQMFSTETVLNNLEPRHELPGKIEAEDFDIQNGLGTEETTDAGGGLNISYTDVNDYADYKIFVRNEGTYQLNLRVAAQDRTGRVGFYLVDNEANETELVVITTPRTGGWQDWETVSEIFTLPAGIHTLRMKVLSSGFNMNWFDVTEITLSTDQPTRASFVYPNPARSYVNVQSPDYDHYVIVNLNGSKILGGQLQNESLIDLNSLKSGMYVLILIEERTGKFDSHNLLITK